MNEGVNFVKNIIEQITDDKDCFEVESQLDERGVLISLTVDDNNIGRVLGHNGETIKGIRTLLKALGTKNNARYGLLVRKAE